MKKLTPRRVNSLLMSSAAVRVGGAFALVAGLWVAVGWALWGGT